MAAACRYLYIAVWCGCVVGIHEWALIRTIGSGWWCGGPYVGRLLYRGLCAAAFHAPMWRLCCCCTTRSAHGAARRYFADILPTGI